MTWAQIKELVAERAGFRCEYCKMHEAFQSAPFHIEHYIPKSRGGPDDENNLCYACTACNQRKAVRTALIDPEAGLEMEMFNPRKQDWNAHFAWVGLELVGLTPLGKAMIDYFNWNSKKRLLIREVEQRYDLHPPT